MPPHDFPWNVAAGVVAILVVALLGALLKPLWPHLKSTWLGRHPVVAFCGSVVFMLLLAGVVAGGVVTLGRALHQSKPATRSGTVAFEPGDFQLGGDPGAEGYAFEENPQRVVHIGRFALDVHEVTNGQYAAFVRDTGHSPPSHWSGLDPPPGLESHPVVMVTWSDAVAYCASVGGRLPTEDEWERAARWDVGAPAGRGRRWPWGNEWDASRLNSGGSGGGTMPVGSLPGGNTPDGLQDMAGNASEWTSSQYWPGQTLQDFPSPPQSAGGPNIRTAVRGGGYQASGAERTTTTFRQYAGRDSGYKDVGFRCGWDE